MTINELYKLIEQGIRDAIDGEWERAELSIETDSNNSVTFNGKYFINNIKKNIKFDRFYKEELFLFKESILKLKRIMTDISGKNKWNKAVFKTTSEGKLDSKFFWNNKIEGRQAV